MPTIALPKDSDVVKQILDFEFQLRKVEFVFFLTSLQPLRVAACYEDSGPKEYTLDIIIQSLLQSPVMEIKVYTADEFL